ncbi:MAG: metallophosphoesterase [Kiritimatiellia bacterium]
MKVGLLSDTHNHLRESRRALDLLVARGARHLVHCGDAGEDVVDLLSAVCQTHGIRAHVAVGNCDRAHPEDAPFRTSPAGIERAEAPDFVLAGKRCLVLHGDRAEVLQQALGTGQFDFVFTGHTHAPADRRVGKTRLLNPGSAARSRQGPPTVALLDLETEQVAWFPVQP